MLLKYAVGYIITISLVQTFSALKLENEYAPSVYSEPVDKEQIKVWWDHPLNYSKWQSDVAGYLVSYVRNDKITTEPFESVSLPPGKYWHFISGLLPGTRYEIMVSAIVNLTGSGTMLYNSSMHQQKTKGYGPNNGCEHCDVMHTQDIMCDPDTAVCNCKDDLRGGTCAECKPGAVMVLMHCQLCNCDLVGSDGNCSVDKEDETKKVFCHCHSGYSGHTCELEIVNDTTTIADKKEELDRQFGRPVAGIVVAAILLMLVIGALYALQQKLRRARQQQRTAKWLATVPTSDYAYLSATMEPTAMSDSYPDVSFDDRKPQLRIHSVHNNVHA